MKALTAPSRIRTIRRGDPLFRINCESYSTDRAGFEIGNHCPDDYRALLLQAIEYEWIKPVAYITAEEKFLETIKL